MSDSNHDLLALIYEGELAMNYVDMNKTGKIIQAHGRGAAGNRMQYKGLKKKIK